MTGEVKIKADFPEKLHILFKPKRYKILYGGRGGAKSWNIARALLIIGMERPIRVLCARELQNSIEESVHKLLKDQIILLGLQDYYEVQKSKIYGPEFKDPDSDEIVGQTEFSFAGLRHNAAGLRSYEGVDYCWVEEAVNVSKESWDTLIPTIRKEGSEIWASFNPILDSDHTYKRFVLRPPAESYVVKVNWRDNPWFPAVLKKEKDDLKALDPDAYLNVWEGHTKQVLDGAIFANELREARQADRITQVPYDKRAPVMTFWDLGRSDMTSIWFLQRLGFQWRALRFEEDNGHAIDHYIKLLKELPYVYSAHWLPHDGDHKLLHHPLSIKQQLKAAFPSVDVKVLGQTPLEHQINAARLAFENVWFDEELCSDGLQSLNHYQYEVDLETKERSKKPLHNWASHGASAFMTFAMHIKAEERPVTIPKRARPPFVSSNGMRNPGWMRR